MEYNTILEGMTFAPSAHNSQPWSFFIGDNYIDLFADESRHLPVLDPDRRQLYVSLGCAIANGVVAAAGEGQGTRVELFPLGEDRAQPAARLHFESATEIDRHRLLGSAVKLRRTDRSLYSGHNLTHEERTALYTLSLDEVTLIEDRGVIDVVAELAGNGSFSTLSQSEFKKEL